ncbi:hypothetical protein CAC42_7221 [Sphaceloma murrayae]|uniref:Zn(2)-C6 fungal-type domain-containing protein n=1 Tax=Sphaceloma murrayae TaxID=2082308 RepID=A0A2K1QQ00_9PEZI|nr:hypothetical protein CAC42_7221 [Sphaceloma murrayae]
MRNAKACLQCRNLKRKCTTSSQSGPCDHCAKKQVACSLTQPVAPRSNHRQTDKIQPLVPKPEHILEVSLNIPKRVVIDLVELYIYNIHDRPHSLFHLQTLRRQVGSGSVSLHLLYAICAVGCRFSQQLWIRKMEDDLTKESRRLAHAELSSASIELVQTLIILANLFVARHDASTEALYFSMAIRLMQIMDLRGPPSESALDKDLHKRIWWALYMADRWCSSALGIPRQLDDSIFSVGLPIEENRFQALTAEVHPDHVDPRPGMWGYNALLAQGFAHVLDLNRQIVDGKRLRISVDDRVCEIRNEIREWVDNLPEDLVCNEENLVRHQKAGTGGLFVALHLGYFHYSMLLHFYYLDARLDQDDAVVNYAKQCKADALRYSRFLHRSRQLPGCEAVYLTVAHMTIVSSSVLLHTLLFGDDEEVSAAKECLTNNFEALIISRLTKFQQQCLRSAAESTHEMDPWMLRFLVEYALPFDDKPNPSASQGALSPPEDDQLLARNHFATQALHSLRQSPVNFT